jgi:hypothetical protein
VRAAVLDERMQERALALGGVFAAHAASLAMASSSAWSSRSLGK